MKSAKYIIISAIILVVGIAVWLAARPGGEVPSDGEEVAERSQRRRIAARDDAKPRDRKGEARRSKRKTVVYRSSIPLEERTDLSSEEKKVMKAIEVALDASDLDALLDALPDVSASTNAEIRLEMVEALGFFGESVLAEITPFMADPDEEVADAARSAWEFALNDVESPRERLNAAMMVLETITDKDSLTIIASEFSNTATELIDGPDSEVKQNERRAELVLAIEGLIENGQPPNVEAALEIYEDLTGHEWVSQEETQLYLSDTENYVHPSMRTSRSSHSSSEAEVSANENGTESGASADYTEGDGDVVEEEMADGETADGVGEEFAETEELEEGEQLEEENIEGESVEPTPGDGAEGQAVETPPPQGM